MSVALAVEVPARRFDSAKHSISRFESGPGAGGCGAPGSVPGLRLSAAACEIAQVESLGRDASVGREELLYG